ncbi:AAA family ATPase [Pedobacter antarcticus]|uniref:AAA family ATPase n=1 Tax=Pedobacter antarcticus TaxID=34086 RepID=UPI00088EA65B|nr:AAA family ATPase [Pedobacter antarcticus]SDL84491.1 5-methylcytosine-specific restriction enzyme B [Pedobacter antarcticus]
MTDHRYQLIKDFQTEWPYERIKNLSLQEYTNLNKDSFCYWLESKSTDLGSIWGGSAFKFGVYEKEQKDNTYNSRGRLSDSEYAWYAKYGNSKEEAFEKVKSLLIQVLDAARNQKYDEIDRIDLGDTIKWKLAYIYSDNQILNVFNKIKLVEICKTLEIPIEKKETFFSLQDKILKTKPVDQDYFAFGDQFWQEIKPSKVLLETLELIKTNLRPYFQILDFLINELDIQPDSEKVYFNYEKSNQLIFGIGQRYIFNLTTKGFRYISKTPISSNYEAFDSSPEAYLNKTTSLGNKEDISAAIIASVMELLPATIKSGFLKHNKLDFKEMVFNRTFREKVLEQINAPIEDDSQSNENMNHPLNQILFGPPGTGKTYNSIDKAVQITTNLSGSHTENKIVFDRLRKEGQIEFVTFHQGYSYEEFMVGIKPNTDTEQLTFRPHKGIFYRLVEKAKANYKAFKNNQQEVKTFDEIFEELVSPLTNGEVIEIPMRSGNIFKITDVENGTIRFKKPNGSDTHTLSVETLKAIVEGRREFNSGLGTYYKPLVQLIDQYQQPVAAETPLKNYVIIIDEINRANISKVFGELITLLEDDKRMDADNSLSLTLPNGEPDFTIPPNVYIIGTMNTADKSIALVDIALRRRFEFEGFYPDYKVLPKLSSSILQKINEAIYNRKKTADFLIGHGYFMKNETLGTILLKKVIPLLMEYFSGRTDEIRDILKFASIEAVFNTTSYVWNIVSIQANEATGT